jgi:outer membrane protein TolC
MMMTTTMRWTKRISMSAALLTASASCAAQISLSSAVDLALRNDPRVKSAQAAVTKAEAALAQAKDVYIPNLTLGAGYGISSGPPLGVPVVFSLSSDSLILNFSQKDNIRAAVAGLEAVKLSLLDTEQQTAEDVVITYIDLDYAQRRYAALVEEQQHATRLVDIVKLRLDAGQDYPIDLHQSERTSKQVQLAALSVEDEVSRLSTHLAGLMGVATDAPIATIPESIPPMPAPMSMQSEGGDSLGVKSALAVAHSRQEVAFGDARYRYRPQISFGANYSRISTSATSYNQYYPGFSNGKSDNALSVGFHIGIPIIDYEHRAHARESAADAVRAMADAQNARLQFTEGRKKLRQSVIELQTRSDIAELDQQIAQDQIESILIQLNGTSPLTPKDEQNARVQERAREVDLLGAKQQLADTEVNLMRQTGVLSDWIQKTHTLTAPTPSTH